MRLFVEWPMRCGRAVASTACDSRDEQPGVVFALLVGID
jgi:hypothetical protein